MKKIIITKKYIIISILILIFILLKISQFSSIQRNFSSYNEKKFAAKCIKVIDGDTIDISFLNEIPNDCKKNERIRLIGINTPELDKNGIPEYFAKEAFYWTNGELLNQYIYIQFDPLTDKRDKYSRLLCYVYVDKFCINRILIERGYAKFYDNYPFKSETMNQFLKAEKYAKINKLGMWQ